MAIPSNLSQLDAVNLILAGAGEQPVSTLVDDGINDSDFAQQVLNETTMEIMGMGWDCNTVTKEMSIDVNGRISISPNYIRVDGWDSDYRRRLSVRGNRLYDLDNDTDVFEESVTLRITQMLDWDDLPNPLQFYIARTAAVTYQAQTKSDPQQDQVLRAMAMQSQVHAKKNNSKSGDRSWIHDTSGSMFGQATRRVAYGWNGGYDPRPIPES